jgi:hypothetical protein
VTTDLEHLAAAAHIPPDCLRAYLTREVAFRLQLHEADMPAFLGARFYGGAVYLEDVLQEYRVRRALRLIREWRKEQAA